MLLISLLFTLLLKNLEKWRSIRAIAQDHSQNMSSTHGSSTGATGVCMLPMITSFEARSKKHPLFFLRVACTRTMRRSSGALGIRTSPPDKGPPRWCWLFFCKIHVHPTVGAPCFAEGLRAGHRVPLVSAERLRARHGGAAVQAGFVGAGNWRQGAQLGLPFGFTLA